MSRLAPANNHGYLAWVTDIAMCSILVCLGAASLEALLGALQEQRTPAVDAAHPLRSIWSTNGSSLNPTFACQTSSGKPERHDLPTRSQRGQFDL